MKVLLIGSGGREHALAWAMAQSDECEALYCAPGNAGIEACAECVNISVDDIPGILKFSKENKIDFVVVGPEGPLVAGLADELRAAGIAVFGPSKNAARLEGSKAFMKDLCTKYNIPTAAYGRFTDVEKAIVFIKKSGAPIVVKADGLAAGKGVVVAQSVQEAIDAAKDMLSGNAFGSAGAEVVIEEFLDGEELSYFALSDGKTILPFGSAQDHKRVGDGDTGPNTGGMGTYSPAWFMTPKLEKKVLDRIIKPTIAAMAAEGVPYIGVLYGGIMIVPSDDGGEPFLFEYNVRFGDPECQTLMVRLQTDLLQILHACAVGNLESVKDAVLWSDEASLCVVMAAKGYPGAYKKNTVIEGLQDAAVLDDIFIFHAGTARDAENNIVSTGGRVLGVTALGDDIAQAQARAYEAVDKIDWAAGFCRRDIGWRAIKA